MATNVLPGVLPSVIAEALDEAERGSCSGEAYRFFAVAIARGSESVRFDLRPRRILVTHTISRRYRVRGYFQTDRETRQTRLELGSPEWERAATVLETSLRLREPVRGDSHGS